jgi:hypothetical protein
VKEVENVDEPIRGSFIERTFLGIALLWTLLVSVFLVFTIDQEKKQMTDVALTQAKSCFELIVATRAWNASMGGVYAPVSEKIQPNEYLKIPNRDILTTEGEKLTLINPAFMTRLISEISSMTENVSFHITSDKPLRPENGPDKWEKKALLSFKNKGDVVSGWSDEAPPQHFRFMSPLWTDQSCLRCHAEQGYKVGELRGGISVGISAKKILLTYNKKLNFIFLRHALIWLFGLVGIILAFRHASKGEKELIASIGRHKKALIDVRVLKGLVPICSSCKNVRNDKGYWKQIEVFVRENSEAEFSHGICPSCIKKLYPDADSDEKDDDS